MIHRETSLFKIELYYLKSRQFVILCYYQTDFIINSYFQTFCSLHFRDYITACFLAIKYSIKQKINKIMLKPYFAIKHFINVACMTVTTKIGYRFVGLFKIKNICINHLEKYNAKVIVYSFIFIKCANRLNQDFFCDFLYVFSTN